MPHALPRDRILSAAAAAAMVGLLGLGVVLGLRPGVLQPVTRTLTSVFTAPLAVPTEPPPPPPRVREAKPAPRAASRRTTAAAPAAARANPLSTVAPPLPLPPVVVLPTPAAAPVAGTGAARASGSANGGSGQGSGGSGAGSGSGGAGGTGVGGQDDGIAVRARQTKGKLSVGDLLDRLFPHGQDALVRVRYTVEPDGKVDGCTVTQTSGQPEFDARVCQLIEQRFRYDPARDRSGGKVPQVIEGRHEWYTPPGK